MELEPEDKNIELYWYWIKKFIIKYKPKQNEYIKELSKHLNDLQTKGIYKEIYNKIHSYLLYILREIAINYPKKINLIFTNIKRWNEIDIVKNKYNEYIISLSNSYSPKQIETLQLLHIIRKLYIKDINFINDMIEKIGDNIEENKIYFIKTIKYCIENRYMAILEYYNYSIDIRKEINKIYNLNIQGNLSFRKILNNYF